MERKRTNPLLILGFTSWQLLNFCIMSSASVVMPSELRKFYGNGGASRAIGIWVGFGAATQVCSLFVSSWSDSCTSKFGRRRPFILGCSALAATGAAGMLIAIWQRILPLLVVSYYLLVIGIAAGSVILQALIPDLLPQSQVGLASGFFAFAGGAGSCLGFAIFSFGLSTLSGTVIYIGSIVAFTVLCLACAREKQWARPRLLPAVAGSPFNEEASLLRRHPSLAARAKRIFGAYSFNPVKHVDFLLALMERVFSGAAIQSLSYYQLFLKDVLHIEDSVLYASRIGLIASGVAFLVSPVVGLASDKLGLSARKWLLIFGLTLGSASSSTWIWARDYRILLISSSVAGVSLALRVTLEVAILVSCLPSAANPAAFLSEVAISNIVGQLTAIQGFGLLLEMYATGNQRVQYFEEGYQSIYALCSGLDLVAVCTTLFIDLDRAKAAQGIEPPAETPTPNVPPLI